MRHRDVLAANPRTVMQVKNLDRLTHVAKAGIRDQATRVALTVLGEKWESGQEITG